jgi:DNA-binding transcriptional regulator YiaG
MTGDELKAWRARWKLSLRGLAERIGYDHSTIALWESEKRRMPKRADLLIAAVERELRDEKRPSPEDESR